MTDEEIVHLWDTHVNSPTAKYPLTAADKINFARSLLASQAKQAVQPPEFQEVSWGVDSVMRPCKSMAISEYAFREWAETNGIALALPAPIEQITPENTDGVPEPVGINGLTEAETNATASVFGLTRDGVPPSDGGQP